VFLELLEIGNREFAHDGDVNERIVFFDGDHLLASALIGARRKLNMPLAMMSAMPSQALKLSNSCQSNKPNIAENTMVL
jgi:hypothetical protein